MKHYEKETVELFMTLTSALKSLPGVKPNVSKSKIRDVWENSLMMNCHKGKNFDLFVGKSKLTPEEFGEIYIEFDSYYDEPTIKISPKGAKVLLKLYRNGDLEMQRGKIIADAPKLLSYINTEEFYEMDNEKIKRRKYLVKHPEEIKEGDFEKYFLDKVFLEQYGGFVGYKTMTLDDIEVTKHVYAYSSNSGKSQDYEVYIVWTGSDGKQHKELVQESSYKENRRHDLKRNWGLPE